MQLQLLALLLLCFAVGCAAGTVPGGAAAATVAYVAGVGLACKSVLGCRNKRKFYEIDDSQGTSSASSSGAGSNSDSDVGGDSDSDAGSDSDDDDPRYTMPHHGTNARSSIVLSSVLVLMLHVSTWGANTLSTNNANRVHQNPSGRGPFLACHVSTFSGWQ